MPAPAMPAATGPISGMESKMAKMLSECTAFQAWAGVDGEGDPVASALARIHFFSLPPAADENYTLGELTAYRPYARLWMDPEGGYEGTRKAQHVFDSKGKIAVHLDQDTPSTYVGYIAQALRAFTNAIGAIILDLYALESESGNLQIDGHKVIGPIASSDDEIPTLGDSQGALLRFDVQ